MKDYIEDRVITVAQYIAENKCTVRAAAKKFDTSKSTVHKDMIDRLPLLNAALAADVKSVLAENKAERHIRGGLATKAKYEAEKRHA
ncbi:MAG: sporulation transcriptional regulator SpoIIID [Clostridia bacterium]|nr:sporulation transcriptional regulator SpoIIID [Clostridia bacterium]